MAFVVANGTGLWNANAYAGLGYVHAYLHARGRTTNWDAATVARRKEVVIEATDYIDRRYGPRVRGYKEFMTLVVPAHNYLSVNTLPTTLTTFTIGDATYEFRTAPTATNQIAIGANVAESAANIVAAINLTGTADVEYGTGTVINPDVTATLIDDVYILLESKLSGEAGNETAACAGTVGTIDFDFDDLYGGIDEAEQPLEFPRLEIYSSAGGLITGIPNLVRQATAELTDRALTTALILDPTVETNGQMIIKTFDKVGPIETERQYQPGLQKTIFQKYPAVDLIMAELLSGQGGVSR